VKPFKLFPSQSFLEELDGWRRHDPKIAARIARLIEDIARDPYQGIGKPEHLKYFQANLWSRRITEEHRLVYLVEQEKITLLQCRYHYWR